MYDRSGGQEGTGKMAILIKDETMASNWIQHESGPDCWCGSPTYVSIGPKGLPHLVCSNHLYETGGLWPLTIERPAHWPAVNVVELDQIVEQAKIERDEDGEEK
jgi:hypothetical protein